MHKVESVKLIWRTASVHQQDCGQLSGWQLLLKDVAALGVALLIDYLPHKRPAVQGHPKLRREGKAMRPCVGWRTETRKESKTIKQ